MNRNRRPVGILLSLIVIFSALTIGTVTASAEDGVPYVVRSWDEQTNTVVSEKAYCADYTSISSDSRNLSGWYIVNDRVDLSNRLIVNGEANIILCDGAYLYCKDGIRVSKGNTLNIYSQEGETGELYCDADTNDNAAIGADDQKGDCGTVIIHGGKVTADTKKLGTDGAGIGGGDEGNGGLVVIYGGTVKAIGGDYGAGIGGGDADGTGGNGGTTIIYGGDITANGGTDAAGIGGGEDGNGGIVEIWGGTVNANGGTKSAGIGGGEDNGGGTVTINGGTVNANGGYYGAGIGGGDDGNGGYITINGGTVNAKGGTKAAGIGGGCGSGVVGNIGVKGSGSGNITITGGTVTAEGDVKAAGIGSGFKGYVDEIQISGGEVNALAGGYAACIGSQESLRGKIIISGGNITTRFTAEGSRYAAAIGNGAPSGTMDRLASTSKMNGGITISGGTITAYGSSGAAIGSAYETNMTGTIEISGGTVRVSSRSGAAIGSGYGSKCTGKIKVTGGDIEAYVTDAESKAIGCGKKGKEEGTLELNDIIRVASGTSKESAVLQLYADRIKGCRMAYAKLDPCTEHSFSETAVPDNDETHSYRCIYCGFKDEPHIHPHNIKVSKWTWADDCSFAKADIICTVCDFTKEITASGDQISLRTIKAPTYLEDGEGKYTATVTFAEKEYKGSTIGSIPMLSRNVQATYIDLDGNKQTVDATVLVGDEKDIATGWYVVNHDVTFNDRISNNGAVNLILGDGAVMTANQGISVGSGQELTIWGQAEGSGKLIAKAPQEYVAGIGGWEGPSGQITINGGNVEGTSGFKCGAGIGGGGRSQVGQPGYVTVNGGNVKAVGGYGAAGLGGGGFYYDGAGDSGGTGTVVINGGTVDAAGGFAAAAIGGGKYGRGYVTINGGSIKAGSGGIGDGSLGYGRYAGTPLGQVTLNYGDKGCVVYSTEYFRVNVTLSKPFTDGTETYDANTYGVDDARKFNDKMLYAPGMVQVEWKNYDGTLLKKEGIPSGSVPSYSGEKPAKAADEFFTYSFAGWTPEITAITENTSYTATFEETPKIIRPENPCGKVTSNAESAKPGDTVTVYTDPEAGYVLKNVRVNKVAQDKTSVPLTVLDGQGGTGGEGYPKLIDGNINTKWYTPFDGSNYIIFKANDYVSMDAYALTTANDTAQFPGRNWKDWTIYGANFLSDSEAVRASSGWEEITSVKNDSKLPAENFVQREYILNEPAEYYKYYMIKVTAKGESDQYGDTIQMAEFTMYDKYLGESVEVNGSDDTWTFTMPDKPVIVSASYKPSCFAAHSISLAGDVGVVYLLDITDEQAKGNTVKFDWSVLDKGKEVAKSATGELEKDEGTGMYMAICPVSAAEMIYGIEASITLNGKTYKDMFAVAEYADVILSDKTFAQNYIAAENAKGKDGEARLKQLQTLMKTMLDYGSWAQVQFDRTPEILANRFFVTDDPTSPYYYVPEKVDASMINTGSSDMNAGLAGYGLEYQGSTIVYLSKTSMRHYYKVTDQAKFNAVKDEITFNDEKCGYVTKDDIIYFELQDISAPELDTLYALKIGRNEYKYSVLDYVKKCLELDGVADSLRELSKATYRYNKAADIFFGPEYNSKPQSNKGEGKTSKAMKLLGSTVKSVLKWQESEAQFEDEYETPLMKDSKASKKKNTLTVKGKTAKVSYKKLRKKSVTVAGKKVLKVTKAKGTVTYKLVSAKKGKKSFKKYFKVNTKNGKIKVKKGLKKGTYKIRIKVTAKGNEYYKAMTLTRTAKIKIK